MPVKYGMAISTYIRPENAQRIDMVFKKSITSLLLRPFDGPIFLIDDGSPINDHLEWVQEFDNEKRITIVKKSQNGGIAKCKNTSIRLLMESGVDVGFLADDDVFYQKNKWQDQYLNAMEKTGIHHFCMNLYSPRTNTNYKNFIIDRTNDLNGCLITFTRQMIDTLGYFKVLPHKYGHEHTNFSLRAIHRGFVPWYCDIINSKEYLGLIPESGALPSITDARNKQKLDENYKLAWTPGDPKLECIE